MRQTEVAHHIGSSGQRNLIQTGNQKRDLTVFSRRERPHLFAVNLIIWFRLEVSSCARGTRAGVPLLTRVKVGQASLIQCHGRLRREFLEGGYSTVGPFRKGASENGMVVVA